MANNHVKTYGMVFLAVMTTSFCQAGAKKPQKSADSVKMAIYQLYLKAENYNKAINVYEELKNTSPLGWTTYIDLIKKTEAVNFEIDSMKLVLAKEYIKYELEDQAEALLGELIKSNYAATRRYSIQQLDSLVHEKEKKFYEKYPYSPFTEVIKPTAPYLVLLLIASIITYFINRKRSQKSLRFHCNIETETPLYQTALRIQRENILEYNNRNANSFVIPAGSLPFLEPTLSANFERIGELIIPEKLNWLLKRIGSVGLKPVFSLDIFVENRSTHVFMHYRLKKGETLLLEDYKNCTINDYFDVRLDIAYLVLIEIQSVMV